MRKSNKNRMIPVLIHFTPDQLDWMDSVSNYSRSAVVRRCVEVVRRREMISLDAQERRADLSESIEEEPATNMDFEIILDAYADVFTEPLKEAAANGHDIHCLIPTFMGLIEKNLKKSASEQQVRRFLYEKMEELSVTN
jgi:hypothetical protein